MLKLITFQHCHNANIFKLGKYSTNKIIINPFLRLFTQHCNYFSANAYANYTEKGNLIGSDEPGDKDRGEITGDITTSFIVLLAIFFPSCTGQCIKMVLGSNPSHIFLTCCLWLVDKIYVSFLQFHVGFLGRG